MLEVTLDSTFKIKETVSVKNILNESFFILDSSTGKQYDLTEMEFEIVDSIDKGITFGEIVNKIATEYSMSTKQIKNDLTEYFTSLFEAGLILAK